MSHFFIFGSHPRLSLAELQSLLPNQTPVLAEQMAILDIDATWNSQTLQNRLAGITKLGRIIKTIPLNEFTVEELVNFITEHPRGKKILYGLTIFGGSSQQKRELKHLPIDLKKALKSANLSARWITGEDGQISSAAIHKMNLTEEGYDFSLGVSNNQLYIGITEAVQNIDDWSLRDYGRPARDAKNGMLPPKLAHIMINIGLGLAKKNTKHPFTLLDPFCGGGTILMEAGLIDQHLMLIGSDIDTKQIADTIKNLDWLVEKHIFSEELRKNIKLITAPAQTLDKHHPAASIDLIITEGYLGKPLRGQENQLEIDKNKQEIEKLWEEILPHLAAVQPPGGILGICLPSFKTAHGQATCQLNEAILSQFYLPDSPLNTLHLPLSYSRDNQFVKRNLLYFKRK